MRRADLPLLSRWLAAPHVHRWWLEPSDFDAVAATYGPAIDGDDPTELYIAQDGAEPVALLQLCRLRDEPRYAEALRPAGIPEAAATFDYLIGAVERTGQGLGPRLLRRAAQDLWERDAAVQTIAVAVQQANRPSWRALEKAGFTRVWSGLVRTDDPSDAGPSYVYRLDRAPVGKSPP